MQSTHHFIGSILVKFQKHPFTGRDGLIGDGRDRNQMGYQNDQYAVSGLLRDEFSERFQIGFAILRQFIE
jgi:hypothetical protein